MNSTMLSSFAVDNSDTEEPSSTTGTVINQENSKSTEESFHFTNEHGERFIFELIDLDKANLTARSCVPIANFTCASFKCSSNFYYSYVRKFNY